MPVVFTALKKTPSKSLSLLGMAAATLQDKLRACLFYNWYAQKCAMIVMQRAAVNKQVDLQPFFQLMEGGFVQVAVAFAVSLVDPYPAAVFQHVDVLGYCLAGYIAEVLINLVYVQWLLQQQFKDLPAHRISETFKGSSICATN